MVQALNRHQILSLEIVVLQYDVADRCNIELQTRNIYYRVIWFFKHNFIYSNENIHFLYWHNKSIIEENPYGVNKIVYCLSVRHRISSSILFCPSHHYIFQNLQFVLQIQSTNLQFPKLSLVNTLHSWQVVALHLMVI